MHMNDTNLGHIINYILKYSPVFKCERERVQGKPYTSQIHTHAHT